MRNIGVKKGLFAITLSVITVSCVKEANLKNIDQEQEKLFINGIELQMLMSTTIMVLIMNQHQQQDT